MLRRRLLVPAACSFVLLGSALLLPPDGAVAGADRAARADRPSCFGRTATIVGTRRGDRIVGTPGADVIVGLGGRDRIDGRGGDDLVCGGADADTLLGGPGDDRLDGEVHGSGFDRGGTFNVPDVLEGGPATTTSTSGSTPRSGSRASPSARCPTCTAGPGSPSTCATG